MARKQFGKRRKCWLPAFSPFPTMFSKDFFLRVVKSRDCVVKRNIQNILPHKQDFTTLEKIAFENIVRNEENDFDQHSLLFPQCFLSLQRQILLSEPHSPLQ